MLPMAIVALSTYISGSKASSLLRRFHGSTFFAFTMFGYLLDYAHKQLLIRLGYKLGCLENIYIF